MRDASQACRHPWQPLVSTTAYCYTDKSVGILSSPHTNQGPTMKTGKGGASVSMAAQTTADSIGSRLNRVKCNLM